MTKMVRIENADNSDYKVEVEVWAKGRNEEGEIVDQLQRTVPLHYPTALDTFMIHSGQWLVVKEATPKTEV